MADEQLSFEFIGETQPIEKALDKIEKAAAGTAKKMEKGFEDSFGVLDARNLSDVLDNVGRAAKDLAVKFAPVGIALGVAAAEALAFKEALDLTIEGERLRAVEAQFTLLSQQAGLSGDSIRDGLREAGGGLVDITSLLTRANSAFVNLGNSAAKLPEVLELSRKITSALGGDIAQRFDGIVQAIESGNAKLLKQNGIILDVDKVLKRYASSLGLLPNELTLANRQQALLNAALEEGTKRFGDVNTSIQPIADNFSRVKTALGDLKEEFAKSVNSKFGGFFEQLSRGAVEVANDLREMVRESTPQEELSETAAKIGVLQEKLRNYNKQLEESGTFSELAFGAAVKNNIRSTTEQLATLEAAYNKSKQALISNVVAQVDAAKATEAINGAEKEKKLTEEQKAAIASRNLQVQQLQLQANAESLRTAEAAASQMLDVEDRTASETANLNEKIIQLEQQKNLELARVRIQFAGEHETFVKQRNAAIEAIEQGSKAKIQALEDSAGAKRLNMIRQVSDQWKQIIVSGVTNALVKVGENIQKGEAAFSDFGASVVAIVGDMAISLGSALIAQAVALLAFSVAINTLTPAAAALAVAAGVGLVIFGAALKASVGKGGGSTASSSSGGGSAAGPTSENPTFTQPEDIERQAPGTSVSVNVNGNVMGTTDRSLGLAIAQILDEQFSSQGLQIRGAV